MYIRKVSSRNQVTLPKEMVEDLGIKEGEQVAFTKVNGNYIVKKLDDHRLRDFLLVDTKEEYNVNRTKE